MSEQSLGRMMADEIDAARFPFGKRGPYVCPVCENGDEVVEERTEIRSRYQNHGKYHETFRTTSTEVRCMACGESAIYDESEVRS